MKKIICVFLLLACLFSLAACAEEPEIPESAVTVYYRRSALTYGTADGVVAPGYLDEKPICESCGGNGYIGTTMCKCLKELCRQEQDGGGEETESLDQDVRVVRQTLDKVLEVLSSPDGNEQEQKWDAGDEHHIEHVTVIRDMLRVEFSRKELTDRLPDLFDEFPEGLVIDRDDSDQRADVQEYGQRQGTVSGNAHEVLEHGEMTGAGDRQEFGGTLNDAEDDRFEIFHHNRMWLLLL